MFSKSYKLKSNTTLKNSEKKQLIHKILEVFPHISEVKAKDLVSVKASVVCMKLVLNANVLLCNKSHDQVSVYAVDNIPMILETEETLYPTVCALWKLPELVPVITMQSFLVSKLVSGVPLYLPGVYIPEGGVGFPLFRKGDVIAVNTDDNAAVAAVGRATMASGQMMTGAGGVAVEAIQVFGDCLTKENKFGKIERPKMSPATYKADVDKLVTEIDHLTLHREQLDQEWPSLVKSEEAPLPPILNHPRLIPHTDSPTTLDGVHPDGINTETEDGPPPPWSDMDGLLRHCLLSFIKFQGKKVELPLKTNLLYKNHLMAMCPDGHTLDVKKSTHKKIGKFLRAMQEEGLIEVKEIEKGVDALTAVAGAHPAVRQHSGVEPAAKPVASRAVEYQPPAVREVYCVTAAVLDLFVPLKKGSIVSSSEARGYVTQYVKSGNLQIGALVTVDAMLAGITNKPQGYKIKYDEMMNKIMSKMTLCTEMRFADGEVRTVKVKVEPIKMQVATRSGNKKVTLISNLDLYGLNLQEMCKICQNRAAASATLTRPPGAVRDVLLVQGDQTYFMAKLLIETYGMPKKFLEGADKALSKKPK